MLDSLESRGRGGGRERERGGKGGWPREEEERRTTVVNRNYEAARLRICRAGSKRCCEGGKRNRPRRGRPGPPSRVQCTTFLPPPLLLRVYIYIWSSFFSTARNIKFLEPILTDQ